MSLSIVPCTPERFDALIAFAVAHNPADAHHIGFLGVTADDITATIRALPGPPEQSFVVAYEGERLVGMLGADRDEEIGRAWLYGPLVTAEAWEAAADALYNALGDLLPPGIAEQQIFVDTRNANCQAFADRHGFALHGRWAIFSMPAARARNLPAAEAQPWDSRYTAQLADLHARLFPRSNYVVGQMVERLDEHTFLLVAADADTLQGYFYGRVEPESGEAYVDLVGVEEAFRRQGLGRRLMLAGLAALSADPAVRQVNLTVASDNTAAQTLYHTLGFDRERDMIAFQRRLR